jgi:hypothetical protein
MVAVGVFSSPNCMLFKLPLHAKPYKRLDQNGGEQLIFYTTTASCPPNQNGLGFHIINLCENAAQKRNIGKREKCKTTKTEKNSESENPFTNRISNYLVRAMEKMSISA